MKKWPSAITVNLWPYTIRYMNDVNNYVPRRNEHQSPIELFSSTTLNKRLNQFYHFGCPVYVLDHNLQSGKRSGMKWRDRVRVSVNLGFSPQHAKTVHLVLSLTSGCVSPQFHCTFDSNFETLKEYEIPLSLWQEKAHFVSKENRHDESQVTASTSSERGEIGQESGESRTDNTNEEITDTIIHTPEELEPPLQQEPLTTTNAVERQDPGIRRSNRNRRLPNKFKDYVMGNQSTVDTDNTCIHGEIANPPVIPDIIAHKSVTDPDTLYLWQARKEPDFPQFMEAMQQEIDAHTKGGHWEIIRRSYIPNTATVLPAVWSMKRKRRISDRQVYKWKARLNIDGSRQIQGLHYQDT
jgi:hypothetical protein